MVHVQIGCVHILFLVAGCSTMFQSKIGLHCKLRKKQKSTCKLRIPLQVKLGYVPKALQTDCPINVRFTITFTLLTVIMSKHETRQHFVTSAQNIIDS